MEEVTVQCTICLEDHESLIHLSNCTHEFCKDCLTCHCRNCIKSNLVPVLCPATHCNTPINETELKDLLSNEELKRVKKFTKLKNNKNLRCCPECNEFNERTEEDPIISCSNCCCKYCFLHSNAHPVTMSCSEYENLQSLSAEEQSSLRLIQESTKPCPQCKQPIELAEGCDHVHCTACDTKFCYACGGAVFNGKYFPVCVNCGGSYMDHDYFWIWRLLCIIFFPLWFPLAILWLFFSLCCSCCWCPFFHSIDVTRYSDRPAQKTVRLFLHCSLAPFWFVFMWFGCGLWPNDLETLT